MHQRIFSFTLLLLLPTFLLAHGSHGNGVLAGFTHPILGLDHNVAILGSGLLGYLIDSKKWYLVSSAFIIAMVVGGFLGVDHEATLFIEKTIAFSVFFIGLTIVLRNKLNLSLILVLLSMFGGFHGYAHGAEMDEMNTVFKYIPGYTLGATLLAGLGVFIGKMISTKDDNNTFIVLASGVVIGCGIMMLLG